MTENHYIILELLFLGLIALFPPIFCKLCDFAPLIFYERFCTLSFVNCVLFKIIIKREKNGQKMGCKITKKKIKGAKSHNWQKDRVQKCN